MSQEIDPFEIRKKLLDYVEFHRNFPWRNLGNDESYKILITEILLRRTTGKNVMLIWYDFFEAFPKINFLYKAKEEEISVKIQKLGLHNQRAKQLKKLSKIIIEKYNGEFPNELKEIRDLPGVGSYTVGAFSILRGEFSNIPIDVNVHRVLGRITQNHRLDTPKLNKLFMKNQKTIFFSILDISAQLCRPINPKCEKCPLFKICLYPRRKLTLIVSRNHVESGNLVVGLTYSNWKKLQSDNSIIISLKHRYKDKNKDVFVYVQKPITGISGVATLSRRKDQSILSLKTKYSPPIALKNMRIYSDGIKFKIGLNLIEPDDKLYKLISIIIQSK